nr:selenium-binding family protein [Shewanella xiamenensis]
MRREYRRVVAASEGNGDCMISAIGAGNGEAVGERGTGFELLDG